MPSRLFAKLNRAVPTVSVCFRSFLPTPFAMRFCWHLTGVRLKRIEGRL